MLFLEWEDFHEKYEMPILAKMRVEGNLELTKKHGVHFPVWIDQRTEFREHTPSLNIIQPKERTYVKRDPKKFKKDKIAQDEEVARMIANHIQKACRKHIKLP